MLPKFLLKFIKKIGIDNIEFLPDNILDTIKEEDKPAFFNELHNINKNRAFKTLLGFLVKSNVLYYAQRSTTDEDRAFTRGTINGIKLILDELERFSGLYEDQLQKEVKDFDKTLPI